MKKIILLFTIAVLMVSCGCPDDSVKHKFQVGQDVHIKHKTFHSDATVTKLLRDGDCNCMYQINYYSHMGVRRHRTVTEGEIEEIGSGSGDLGIMDKVTDGIGDLIKKNL
jgi:hypothetical protein